MSFPGGSGVEKPPASAGDVSSILGREDPLGEGMATAPGFLPGEAREQRSPAGRSAWGRAESGRTEWGASSNRADLEALMVSLASGASPPELARASSSSLKTLYLLCLGIFLKLFLWSFPLFPLMSHPPPLNTLLVKCWISWIEPLISFFLFTFHLLSIYSAFYPFPQWLRWSRIRLQYGRPGFDPWVGRSAGGGHSNPLQDSCLENSHGQKSLAGYSPWGRKESDRTEGLGTTILLSGVFPQLYLLTSYWVFLLVCLFKYSFIWLLRVLVAAHWVLVVTCGISFPNQRLTQNPALGARSLSHWPTREVSYLVLSF